MYMNNLITFRIVAQRCHKVTIQKKVIFQGYFSRLRIIHAFNHLWLMVTLCLKLPLHSLHFLDTVYPGGLRFISNHLFTSVLHFMAHLKLQSMLVLLLSDLLSHATSKPSTNRTLLPITSTSVPREKVLLLLCCSDWNQLQS